MIFKYASGSIGPVTAGSRVYTFAPVSAAIASMAFAGYCGSANSAVTPDFRTRSIVSRQFARARFGAGLALDHGDDVQVELLREIRKGFVKRDDVARLRVLQRLVHFLAQSAEPREVGHRRSSGTGPRATGSSGREPARDVLDLLHRQRHADPDVRIIPEQLDPLAGVDDLQAGRLADRFVEKRLHARAVDDEHGRAGQLLQVVRPSSGNRADSR